MTTISLPHQPHHAPNDRNGHWRARHDAQRAWREAAGWCARQLDAVDPPVVVTLTGRPPDRRRRDVDGWSLAAKAAIDGLRDAGVIADDSWAHVREVRLRAVPPDGSGEWGWWLSIEPDDGLEAA